MKKIFTLMFGTLAAVAAVAAAPRPQVIINSTGNYEVRIDGRAYVDFNNGSYGQFGNYNNNKTIALSPGVHTVEIYRPGNGGLFGKRRKLVSTQQFNMQYSDIVINVGQNGYAQVTESRRNNWDRGRDRNDDNNGRDRDDDRNGRGNGVYNNGRNNNGGYNNGGYNNGGYNNGRYGN